MFHPFSRAVRVAVIGGTALLASAAARACSSCGCMLNTNWDSQGYAVNPGWRLDLRYDDLNQSQLRSGTKVVDRGEIVYPTDREIQQGTKNHNVTLGLDYAPNRTWGVNVEVPYIDRPHTTIVDGDTDASSSLTRGVGDARVIGRYQGFSPEKDTGVQLGLKLPMGSFHETFRDGPQADTPLDRGLQAGTGTTDLLLGVYHFHTFSPDWGYFAQGTFQQPLSGREGFTPGSSFVFSAGMRYTAGAKVVPQLQVNEKTELKEVGENSDRPNSGSTLVNVSPGVTVSLTRTLNAFGFLQVPVYQNVDGYQPLPRATFSLGLRYMI